MTLQIQGFIVILDIHVLTDFLFIFCIKPCQTKFKAPDRHSDSAF